MAKFNEYPQKATPEDADTLMIYDTVTKTNKLSPFSGIWNWIVRKLTNAVISNLQTSNQTVIGAINELGGNSHLGTLNDNIAEYLRKTKKVATAYFVWGNIGGLYPSWAWGTLLCSNDNTANFIGIANSNKTAAFAHYENGAWEKVPVESLSNLTTTNKSSLVGAINELNSKTSKLALKENVTNIQALISKASSGTCILFHLSGANYAGNDLPIGEKYKYGSGIIFYRNSNSCKIVLFPEEMKPVWKMANWAKWKDFANNIVD